MFTYFSRQTLFKSVSKKQKATMIEKYVYKYINMQA